MAAELAVDHRKTLAQQTVRIVAVADTHLSHDLKIPPGDIFLHAGDMCAFGTFPELCVAASWISELPHPHKVVIAGNHDWPFMRWAQGARQLFASRGIVYLQDEAAVVSGLRMYGSPWQPFFGNWAFNRARGDALREVWAKIPEDLDVLITHGPPHGIGDCYADEHHGCEDLLARVRVAQPRLHIFGHIHEDGGYWVGSDTSYANVTVRRGGREATVIDIVPSTGSVIPVVIPPASR